MSTEKKLQIRNSTAEFLVFTGQAGEDSIEVRVAEETVWLSQKLLAELFEVKVPTIHEHLSNLYAQAELLKATTVRNFRTVQKEGAREVARLNAFLQFNERDILDHPGKVSQAVARAFAESEFEKYRVMQDKLFESDFDRHVKKLLED